MASTYTVSESLHAYLFECEGDAGLFAVSLEPLGSNIPLTPCFGGWHMREEFELGVHEAMPVAIDPEPVPRVSGRGATTCGGRARSGRWASAGEDGLPNSLRFDGRGFEGGRNGCFSMWALISGIFAGFSDKLGSGVAARGVAGGTDNENVAMSVSRNRRFSTYSDQPQAQVAKVPTRRMPSSTSLKIGSPRAKLRPDIWCMKPTDASMTSIEPTAAPDWARHRPARPG